MKEPKVNRRTSRGKSLRSGLKKAEGSSRRMREVLQTRAEQRPAAHAKAHKELLKEVTQRKQTEDVLRANELAERRLRERFATLHEVILELSKVRSFDELCRQAIQLGLERLGFDRLGLWFGLPNGEVQASFGTDESGRVRDERWIRFRPAPTAEVSRFLACKRGPAAIMENVALPNHRGRVVGRGTRAVAVLWDGDKVIGYLSADNLIHHRPLVPADGQLLTLYATALGHLCSRLRAEEAQQRSEAMLAESQRITHVGSWEWDLKTKVLFWSAETYRVFGVSPASFEPTIERFVSFVHPEDRQFVSTSIRKAIYEKVPYDLTHRIILADGRERVIHEQGKVFYDAKNQPIRTVGTACDVTDIHRTQEALRQSEEKYRQLFATETDAIMLADAKTGRFIDVNDSACRLYGYAADEFLRRKKLDVTAEPRKSALSMKETIRKKRILVPLRYHKKKDGTVFPVEIAAGVFHLRDRAVICMAVRDITDRVRAEAALIAARAKLLSAREEERRRLSRELHDSLAQKLLAVSLHLESFRDQFSRSRDDPQTQPLEELAQQLQSALEEVRQVSHQLYPPALEMMGLFASLQQLKRDLQSTRTSVSIRSTPRVAKARYALVTEISLYRIAQEAMSNAFRHGSPRNIELSLACAKGCLQLTVTDDGMGFHYDKADNDGLGLISMRERAEAVGGTLQVTSHPGKTRVEVRVPVAQRQ